MQDLAASEAAPPPQAPSYIASALLQCGLQLRRVPGKRFGVFALKSFAAGSSILTEDPAACCVSRNATKRSSGGGNAGISPVSCALCMRDDAPLMKCAACGAAHYCCKEHQVAHWPRHKTMCALLKKITKEELQQPEWQQHYSVICLCAHLIESASSSGPARPSAASVSPGHDDIVFLCTTQLSPAASAVTSALARMLGNAANECERGHFLCNRAWRCLQPRCVQS